MREPGGGEAVRDHLGPPDPGDARTVRQFVASLRELKKWSGLTYRQLERRAAEGGDFLPHSTLAGALSRDRLPRRELVIAFVAACGCPSEDVAKWTAIHSALASGAGVACAVESRLAERPVSTPRRYRKGWRVGVALLALLVCAGGISASDPGAGDGQSGRPLLEQCPEPMAMGTRGTCALDLQRHLQRHGLVLPADGWFGPFTKTRVMAFQVFAGLPPSAQVDAATKRAVLTREVGLIPRHSRVQIEHRIRETFTAAPAEAVALADCLSRLDPLKIFGARNAVRHWGLFQLTDAELHELNVAPINALNSEWNIKAAHTIWKRTRSFRNWRCKPATDDPAL